MAQFDAYASSLHREQALPSILLQNCSANSLWLVAARKRARLVYHIQSESFVNLLRVSRCTTQHDTQHILCGTIAVGGSQRRCSTTSADPDCTPAGNLARMLMNRAAATAKCLVTGLDWTQWLQVGTGPPGIPFRSLCR